MVGALNEIGAVKSAEFIARAIELLPSDGSWFFDSSDEHTEELMRQCDSGFSDYPDGFMSHLYRQYAEKHKEEVCAEILSPSK